MICKEVHVRHVHNYNALNRAVRYGVTWHIRHVDFTVY